jgi:hypothetical protein
VVKRQPGGRRGRPVDPSTGNVLARSPGTATISVLSGGVTGTVTVTVSRRRG